MSMAIQCTGSSVRCGRPLRWRHEARARGTRTIMRLARQARPRTGAFRCRSIEFCSPHEFGRIGQIERARSFAASAEALVKQTAASAGLLPRFIGSTARCCVANHCETTGLPCACSNARLPLPGSSGGRLGIAHGASASRAWPAPAGAASGRAEARNLPISTRRQSASAETSRDLREADDLVEEPDD